MSTVPRDLAADKRTVWRLAAGIGDVDLVAVVTGLLDMGYPVAMIGWALTSARRRLSELEAKDYFRYVKSVIDNQIDWLEDDLDALQKEIR